MSFPISSNDEDKLKAEINNLLDRLPNTNALKELFWSCLGYNPMNEVLPKRYFNQRIADSIFHAELFGESGSHYIIYIKLQRGVYPNITLLKTIVANLSKYYPFCIYIFTTNLESECYLAHYSTIENRPPRIYALGGEHYNLLVAKLLMQLAKSIENDPNNLKAVDDIFIRNRTSKVLSAIEKGANRDKSLYIKWGDCCGKYKVLSPEEEKREFTTLIDLWPYESRDNINPPDIAYKCWEKIICSNLKFVLWVIHGYYYNRGQTELMEYIQEGNIGLMEAAKRFNPRSKYRFNSYAIWYIKAYINRYISDCSFLIRLPPNKINDYKKVKKLEKSFLELSWDERISQISSILDGFDHNRIEQLLQLPVKKIRLENSMADFLAYMPEHIDFDTKPRIVEFILSELNAEERDIIDKNYGINYDNPWTLEAIGKIHGLTRERMRQKRENIINKLRHEKRLKVIKNMLGIENDGICDVCMT